MGIGKGTFEKSSRVTLLFAAMFACGQLQAQHSDEWKYFVGGYLTTASIDADTTSFSPAGDQIIGIDIDFNDILDNFDYGAAGIFIARHGKVSVNVDLAAFGVSPEQSLPLPSSTADIDIDIQEHELYLGYAAFDSMPKLEIIAGARYIDQDISVSFNTPSGAPQLPSLSIGDSWTDPFIGVRYTGTINDSWGWLLRGDIGGFGVGSDSAWRIDAGVTYRFAKQWEAALWYKALDIDYESGTSGTPSIYKWDGTESGLTLGIGYYF